MLRSSLDAEASSRFEVLGPLGSGGFGAVYEAIDRRTERRVALKELDNTSADAIARFKHEFRALADCHHPNLVGLYELIEQNGRWLIVMELVPGDDLHEYVCGEQTESAHRFDEGRVRSAFSGVAEGLKALHAYGVLHRDLKPSNVRVRPDGRAVLLDFGLATSVNPKQQSTHAMAVGTVSYMAPEQGGGSPVTPATDFYALGVCLFEALTGRMPFESERAVAILLAKQQDAAPRASTFNPAVPADLDELCARLLATDPGERPSADDVLATLSGDASRPSPPREAPPAPAPELLFAGRERELEYLDRSLSATHRGELRIVLVEGESGVGKSELVAEFLRQSAARHPKLLALRGRCYENEHVSYKAFDGCIDELSKFLRRLPETESAALLPARATLLGQLFPVLRNVRTIAKSRREGVAADPIARRLEAFEALASLLAKVAEERPLVLVVDDLQWADAESFRMLQALVQRAAPPPLLLVTTVRPREELEGDVLAQVNAMRTLRNTDVVSLFGLPREQAKALALKLLGGSAPEPWLDMIADESEGHPLFLGELVQFTQSRDLGSRGRLTLEAALRARVDRLDKEARDLLEVVAVAARPHGAQVFARALDAASIEEPARRLLAAKLLRLRKGQELGCYHDRIRRTVKELIASSRSTALHRTLARALSSAADVDPGEQAHHWDLAGDLDRAISTYEVAVDRAVETLAFDRAALLAERALELCGGASDERTMRLVLKRAQALAAGGRSQQAAALFQVAADGAHGAERVRLRSSAAQQLVLSGKTADGVRAAEALLRELGFRVPLSGLGTLFSIAWDSMWLALSTRLGLDKLRRRPPSPNELLRFEVLNELTRMLALANPAAMFIFTLQQLRLTSRYDFGDSSAISLSSHGWLTAIRSGLARALPLFEESHQKLEGRADSPELMIMLAHFEGSARAAGHDWRGASACLERAEALAREHTPDRPHFTIIIRYHLGVSLYHLGEHARLARESEVWLAEIRERNDALGEALLCGMGHAFIRHLLRDDPEAAHEEITRTLGSISPEPFSFAHLGLFLARSYTHFYQGGPAGLRFLDSFEAQRKRTSLFRTGVGDQTYVLVRCQALLHAATRAEPAERTLLLEEARKAARRRRRNSPLMEAFSSLFLAQIEALEERRAVALDYARAARRQFEELGHALRVHAGLLESLLEGGDAAGERYEAALAVFREQGWKEPARGLRISLPTLATLQASDLGQRAKSKRLLLDRYEVLDSLGSGGNGSVVSARDVQTGRTLALKELVRTGGKSLERFKREFRALQEVHHANLGRIDALFEHDGRWYIAMELVPGTDLVSFVRPNGRCDMARVRIAFAGLASGLRALHHAGFVHRDVTPRNVRVTSAGRPVLLDFGLIGRAGDPADRAAVGTAEYAAPEQLSGCAPSPQHDVYALGACLYECLFGRPPFEGSTPLEIAAKSRSGLNATSIPTSSSAIARCCVRMLSPRAEERPPLHELLAALSEGDGARPANHDEPNVEALAERRALFFSGRERELERLRAAFDNSRERGLTFAFVEGESGVGKSALVNEFAARLARGLPSLLVLTSRCYENEQLAYKAFDGAVDQLAAHLRALPTAQCEALLPKKAALLAQLFPVLTSVAAIADAPRKGFPADPAAQKREALACFFDLIANLAAHTALSFVIDDLQWADGESLALLQELYAQRARMPLLLLCTVRPAAELTQLSASAISALRALPDSEHVALTGLSTEAARELVRKWHDGAISEDRVAELVDESKGHPLFLRELVAQAARGAPGAATTITLDGALRAHIDSLSEEAQTLLSLAALARRPLPTHVFALALRLPDVPREPLVALLANGFLRRRGELELACFHDRIRTVALSMLSDATRRSLAGALAGALEAALVGEAAERARLWDEAEHRERALLAYEQAGDRALAGFAFAQAASFYARALMLSEPSDSPEVASRTRRLLEQQGHALVRAGQSGDAARAYQEAAKRAEGESKVRLRILAAQHLLQSAAVREGLAAASELLEELGTTLPKSERSALARMGWERTRVKVRGLELKPKRTAPSAHDRLLLDALHGLSSPVRAISYVPGSALVVQYLRRALDAGEPIHSSRALAYEALFRTVTTHSDQTRLFERSRELALASGEPAALAENELLRGLSYFTVSGYRAALMHLSRAHEILTAHCPGEPWLLTTARMYLGYAWFGSEDLAHIQRNTGEWIEQALSRDDRYAFAAVSGFGCGSVRHVIADRPEQALAELEAAMAPWPDDPELFSNIHLGWFVGYSHALGYIDPERCLAWIDSGHAHRRKTYLMRTRVCRDTESHITLHTVVRCASAARGEQRERLLERADAILRDRRASKHPLSRGQQKLYRGIVLLARGERARAVVELRSALTILQGVSSRFTYSSRYLLGALEGGAEGRASCDAIRETLRSQGYQNVERALSAYIAGRALVE